MTQITILGLKEGDTDAKNWAARNYAYELTNTLEMVKEQFRLLNRSILMSELGVRAKLRFWAWMRTQTRKLGCKEFSF